jgi:hypothetical protein
MRAASYSGRLEVQCFRGELVLLDFYIGAVPLVHWVVDRYSWQRAHSVHDCITQNNHGIALHVVLLLALLSHICYQDLR